MGVKEWYRKHRERDPKNRKQKKLESFLQWEEKKEQEKKEEKKEKKELPSVKGLGFGRRRIVVLLKRKQDLQPVEVSTSSELVDALKAISVLDPEGKITVWPQPEEILDTYHNLWEKLPSKARKFFVQDEIVERRINAARRQFNIWKARKLRIEKMPSVIEAGRSKYPAQKARKRSRSAERAAKELREKLDKVRAGLNGAYQRALEKAGTTVAEYHEKLRKQKRKKEKKKYKKGMIVEDPIYDKARVKRVNPKTITLEQQRYGRGFKREKGEPYIASWRRDPAKYNLKILKKHGTLPE